MYPLTCFSGPVPPGLGYHANKPKSHNLPKPILSHIFYELLQFVLCKEIIQCQQNKFFCCLAGSCLQTFYICSVIFLLKIFSKNEYKQNNLQTIKEISAFSGQSCINSGAPATDSFHWNLHFIK